MLTSLRAAVSHAWTVASAGMILPRIPDIIPDIIPDTVDPNRGLPLYDFVPVILDPEDFSTRKFRVPATPAESDHALRSDKLKLPLDCGFYAHTHPLPFLPSHGHDSTMCVITSPHGTLTPHPVRCHEAVQLPSAGRCLPPSMKVLPGPSGHITLTSPHVELETGPPGLHAQHSRYVHAPRPDTTPAPVATPGSEGETTDLLLPSIMQFGE